LGGEDLSARIAPIRGLVPSVAHPGNSQEGCMSRVRGILVGLLAVAAAAHAEEVAAHVRAGVWRTLQVPLLEEKAEPGPVPELHVAPGSATVLILPSEIIGPNGFKVVGGEGRVDVRQMNGTTLVLLGLRDVGPERIPLAVATANGRRYPFLLA